MRTVYPKDDCVDTILIQDVEVAREPLLIDASKEYIHIVQADDIIILVRDKKHINALIKELRSFIPD